MTAPTGEEQKKQRLPSIFWLLSWASALSKFGNTFLMLAVPWALLESTSSALVAGLGMAVQFLPYAASPLLGALIDRFDRRRVFVISEVAQAALVACLPLTLQLGGTAVTLVLLVFIGIGNVVSNLTTDYSLVPSLLKPSQLALGYSRYGMLTQAARFIGPIGAGVLIGRLGVTPALLLDAATFLVTAAVAVRMPVRQPRVARRKLGPMLVSGLRAFVAAPRIPALSTTFAIYNVGAGALPALVVFAVQQGWGWSADVAGLLLSFIAVGAAAGAWLAERLWQSRSVLGRIGPWFGVGVLGGLILMVPSPIAVAVGLTVLGMGEGGTDVAGNTYRAKVIPTELAGRVNSLVRAVAMTAVLASPFVIDGATRSFTATSLWFAPVAVFSLVAWLTWTLSLRRSGPDISS